MGGIGGVWCAAAIQAVGYSQMQQTAYRSRTYFFALLRAVPVVGLLVLGLLFLLARPVQAEDLSGRWYGEGYQGRQYLHWLSERTPDGRFFVEFREYKDCKLVYRVMESGNWFVANGVMSTFSKIVPGRNMAPAADEPLVRKDYVLLALAPDVITYRHVTTGILFTAHKVDDKFEWPGCDPNKLTS